MEKYCNLCGKKRKIVKSHIIPKSFYTLKEDKKLKIYNCKKNSPKPCHNGIYDQIVCEDCEKIFAKGDDYIIRFLKQLDRLPIPRIYYSVDKFNIKLIDEFIISLLFRAGITNREEFQVVKLGTKYENLCKAYLTKKISFPPEIQYFICKYDKKLFITNPFKRKLQGCNCYIFILGIYEITIKIDQRKFSEGFELLASHNENFIIFLLDHKNTLPNNAIERINENLILNSHFNTLRNTE